MSIHSPFVPRYSSNVVVTPGAASATSTLGAGNKSLLLVNTGANVCYVRTGLASDGAVAATTADVPVAAASSRVIGKPQDHDTVAYISAAGTTLNVMAGEGGVN